MIEKRFLIPECYVFKIPKCDDCKVELQKLPYELLTYPAKYHYQCPECKKEYTFLQNEVEGEWRWRTI